MYVETPDRNVQTFGTSGEKAAFQVALTPKMAQQLSNPYSDTLLAILRELGNNAMDAHIAAGKPNAPIEIDMPTWLMPQITFRDHGTGMSHEFVMRSFNTWGISTKDTKTKDPHQRYTGSLGRGSKVGFGYNSQSFTVTSYYDGYKSIYSAYVDEDEMPVLVHVRTEQAPPNTGVEITLPVALDDVSKFHQKARDAFAYWDPQPILNNFEYEISTPSYIMSGGGWGVRENLGNGARAIMGRVQYPIDDFQFMDYDIHRILKLPIDIHFNLGDLDFTESRESLRYVDWVKNNIIERCKEIKQELPSHFDNYFTDCRSMWEASVKLKSISRSHSWMLQSMIHDYAHFNGQKVKNDFNAIASGVDFCFIERRHWGCDRMPFNWRDDIRISPNDNVYVVWDDRTNNKKRRMLEYNFPNHPEILIIRTDDKKDFTEVWDMLGNPPYLTWADMEEPPKASKTSPSSKRQVKKLHPMHDIGDNVDKDVEKGGYYVYLSNRNLEMPQGDTRVRPRVERAVAEASRMNLLGDTIYGIPATHRTVPNKRPQWMFALPLIEYAVRERINWDDAAAVKSYQNAQNKNIVDLCKVLIARGYWPSKKCAMYNLMNAINYINNISQEQRNLIRLADYLDLARPAKIKPTYDVEVLAKKAGQRYPMLERFLTGMRIHSDEDAQSIINHVNS